MKQTQNEHSSMMSYSIGFVSSIILTVSAYAIVVNHWLSGWQVTAAIVLLAVVQLMAQLFLFLHLGREEKPRWNLAVFLFMLMVLVIIVAGSLWIMNNLDYNMMKSPQEMDKYMKEQSGGGF